VNFHGWGGLNSESYLESSAEGLFVYINTMTAFLPWIIGVVFWVAAADKPPALLRVHLQAPEGAKGQASIPVTLFDPAETIAIRSLPEVTEKDIRRVQRRLDGTSMVEFNDFGRTKLEVATSTSRGLILVVIVNSRVVYAPLIDTVINKGALVLPAGAISEPEEVAFNQQADKQKK